MKYYTQLIPVKVNNEIEAIHELLKSSIKGYCPEYLLEVLSIVSVHTRKDESSTPLKMTYIKKLVPQGDKYLKCLIELGIIERSGIAIKGKSSYQYKYTEAYYSKFVAIPLSNMKLIRRIELAMKGFQKEGSKTTWGRSEQIEYLKLLQIDPGYSEFIEKHFGSDTNKYNAALGSAVRIENGDIFYSVDNTSKRFHSNVTNISKELRPFLRVKGQSLVNIDVKNCQPYLSTIILTNPSKVSYLTENPAFAMLLQTLKVSMTEDVKKYISLVVSGQLYEYLMKVFSDNGLILTRDETKIQVLRILFARNRSPKDEVNKKTRQLFIASFPEVHKIFSKIRGSERGDKFSNFKRFAILLQRIEAYLMLDVVLKRIYRELPGIVAITIHDSIMTGILTNDVEAVRKIIDEELTLFVGFRPKIKIEGLRDNKKENKRVIQYGATNFVSAN